MYKKHSSSVQMRDKRDYCLSSLTIKDKNVKEIVNFCEFLLKSIDDIYDSIIINKEVIPSIVVRHLKSISKSANNLMEDLHE